MKKLTTEDFIEKAENIHGNRYNYSEANYINNITKVIIICPNHQYFVQSPDSHLHGSGCPKCVGKNKTSKEFIEQAIKIHGNKYNYEKVEYISSIKKITIICKTHNNYEQTPNSHLQGKGCPKCGGTNVSNTEEFIKKANIIHNHKYNYDKVNYINSNKKIVIRCLEHGEFSQTPNSHLNNKNCPKCSSKFISNTEKFIEQASKIHNLKYNYDKVNYINYNTKIIITCKIHEDFEQTPAKHLMGQGCSTCVHIISKPETEWLDSLNIPKEYRHKYLFINKKRYTVDALDPTTKIVYEFYGDYWHGNPDKYNSTGTNKISKTSYGELYQKTLNKETALKEAGYNLITIWESDFLQLQKELKKAA